MTKFKDLAQSYYETKNPVYLGKKRTLELELESGGKKPSNDQLTSFLLGQTAYNLFKNPRKKFPRRPIIIKAPWECASCDLADVQGLSRFNHQKSWIFLIVDNFSKQVFLTGILDKGKKSIQRAYDDFFEWLPAKFRHALKLMHTDEGL